MPRILTLSVIANPYAHLDHEGRPCGAVLLDPVDHHAYGEATVDAVTGQPRYEPRRYVGAELDTHSTKIVRKAGPQGLGASGQSDLQDTVWKFSDEPQTIPQTNYYLARIRDGELIPADAETAALAGRAFVEPKLALANAKTHALGLWFRARPHHDVPEWAHPDDFAKLHEDYSSKEHKAKHAKHHAKRELAKHEAKAKADADAKAAAEPKPALVVIPPTTPAGTPSVASNRSDEVK